MKEFFTKPLRLQHEELERVRKLEGTNDKANQALNAPGRPKIHPNRPKAIHHVSHPLPYPYNLPFGRDVNTPGEDEVDGEGDNGPGPAAA